MANHFRSSEGQDGMAPVKQAEGTMPYEAQPAPADQVDQTQSSAQTQAPAQPAVPAPQPEANVASRVPSMNIPVMNSQPTQAQPVSAPQPDDSGLTAIPADDRADASFDPSNQPGFTTAFAPITSDVDTTKVNEGSTPVISFQDVSMIYPAQPNKPALQGVNVDVYAGEFVFLVGHSGSGKSTFLKLITRELKPTHGRVMVSGQDLTNMRNWKVPYLRRQIGCVFQDFKLLPDKTIFDNVAFALECIGKPRSVVRAQVPEVLRLVGLGEKMDVYPDQLSGGEQQRVSVARAMVNRPPLLVCDEPTGNLDPAISLGIMKLLERINRTGTTILMATHDREMVDSMRKRVIALEAGHVVRDQERGGYGFYGSF